LTAGLYIIPAKKFDAARVKGTWDRHRWDKCRPWFDLDKAWSEFDQLLKRRPAPLGCAIAGDVRVAGDQPGFNLVSPAVAAEIARALADLPVEEILGEIERDRGPWEGDRREVEQGYYERFFEELRKAYALAASEGAAVGILIC
jgi:hypothetical protein